MASSSRSNHQGESVPRNIPGSSPLREPSEGPADIRQLATMRLGSPVLGHGFNSQTQIATASNGAAPIGTPPRSGTPSRFNTPFDRIGTPPRTDSPFTTAAENGSKAGSVYGSFDSRRPIEDPDIVRRHLVTEGDLSNRGDGSCETGTDDDFSSLRLQGGDITRGIYRYVEEAEGSQRGRARSKSFAAPRPEPEDDKTDIHKIKVPGGFRRDYIRGKTAMSPAGANNGATGGQSSNLFTNNFLEFLTLYGHFAGEELEDDEAWAEDELSRAEDGGEREPDEGTALLGTQQLAPKRTRKRIQLKEGGSLNAALLLLKSFVGTGVLFLPKAFSNGGMLFSSLVLLFVSALSYYCFVLLVKTRFKVPGSFGDIGGAVFGPKMRWAILFSIVISQIGFASAYIVFTSANLQAFISKSKWLVSPW